MAFFDRLVLIVAFTAALFGCVRMQHPGNGETATCATFIPNFNCVQELERQGFRRVP
jgi:hypothetical protein